MRFYGIHYERANSLLLEYEQALQHHQVMVLACRDLAQDAKDGMALSVPHDMQVHLVEWCIEDRKRRGDSPAQLESLQQRMLAKAGGAITPEEIEALLADCLESLDSMEAQAEQSARHNDDVERAHAFAFEGGIADLLQATSAPDPLRLPFPSCYLDVALKVEGVDGIMGVLVVEQPGLQAASAHDFEIIAYAATSDANGEKRVVPFATNYHGSPTDPHQLGIFGKRLHDRIARTLRDFVASWAAFVTDPEVIVVQTCKSPNARAKVVKQHGACPQTMRAIRLTGTLRQYVAQQRSQADAQERQGKRVHWVRGHMRRLMAARFTPEKRGTMVWVPPHIRGVGGVPLKRTYRVAEVGDELPRDGSGEGSAG